MRYTFTTKEKLKSKKLTELLFKEGKSFYAFPFKVIYIERTDAMKIPAAVDFDAAHPVQFGISVSTRNFKKAVDRNRVKRLTREVWRHQKHELYSHCHATQKQVALFFIFTQKELPTLEGLQPAISKSITKLKTLLQ